MVAQTPPTYRVRREGGGEIIEKERINGGKTNHSRRPSNKAKHLAAREAAALSVFEERCPHEAPDVATPVPLSGMRDHMDCWKSAAA